MISTRITSLHGSQTSPVVLCMQNNVISIRNTSLYRSLPSYAIFACETATLGPELQVSMGPSPHLWFLHEKHDFCIRNTCLYGSMTSPVILCMQNRVISNRITSLYGSQPSSVVFEYKTRPLDLNSKSLWVSDLTYSFVHAKQRD